MSLLNRDISQELDEGGHFVEMQKAHLPKWTKSQKQLGEEDHV